MRRRSVLTVLVPVALALAPAVAARAHGSRRSARDAAGAAVASALSLRYLPGATAKVAQLVGEQDKQRHEPTLSRTESRYGIEGTDLGYSFEHDGRVYFLFGDTVGRLDRALDTVATTDARDGEAGVRLDFLTVMSGTTPVPSPGRAGRRGGGRRGRAAAAASGGTEYLTVQPSGLSMGAFEVPVSGISLNDRMYVVVSTNHSDDRSTDRSVLTAFMPPSTFKPLRAISQLPAGHFVKMSLHIQSGETDGLPPGGPYVFMWGTGRYRESDAYLAVVPAKSFETGEGTRYFAGLPATGAPVWSTKEADAVPVVRNGTMGDLSVTWCADLRLWLMTYDSRPPAEQGIEFASSPTPWGPWSEPQVIFSPMRDGAMGTFIHNPRAVPPDGLSGPVIGKGQANPEAVRGGSYAPYVVERFTRLSGDALDLYYVLSTWNPYVVVLMRTRLQVER